MTENIVASIKRLRELIVGIGKIFETIFPQTHVLEGAKWFVVRFDPIRWTERHHQYNGRYIGQKWAEHQCICCNDNK